MKKGFVLLITTMLIISILSACSSKSGGQSDQNSKKTIIDSAGAEVEIPENVEKVVCTSASAIPFLLPTLIS